MKTYFKYCKNCERVTEHEKCFAELKQEWMFVCLRCHPTIKIDMKETDSHLTNKGPR